MGGWLGVVESYFPLPLSVARSFVQPRIAAGTRYDPRTLYYDDALYETCHDDHDPDLYSILFYVSIYVRTYLTYLSRSSSCPVARLVRCFLTTRFGYFMPYRHILAFLLSIYVYIVSYHKFCLQFFLVRDVYVCTLFQWLAS